MVVGRRGLTRGYFMEILEHLSYYDTKLTERRMHKWSSPPSLASLLFD